MVAGGRGFYSACSLAMSIGAMIAAFAASRWSLSLDPVERLYLHSSCELAAQASFFVALIAFSEAKRDRAVLALMISVTSIVLTTPFSP